MSTFVHNNIEPIVFKLQINKGVQIPSEENYLSLSKH